MPRSFRVAVGCSSRRSRRSRRPTRTRAARSPIASPPSSRWRASTIANLVSFDGRVYFTAEGRYAKTKTAYELWTSDGTPEGTRLLVDIQPGIFDGFVGIDAEEFGGDLDFAADDGVA